MPKMLSIETGTSFEAGAAENIFKQNACCARVKGEV
jgi:hypothetical protein